MTKFNQRKSFGEKERIQFRPLLDKVIANILNMKSLEIAFDSIPLNALAKSLFQF